MSSSSEKNLISQREVCDITSKHIMLLVVIATLVNAWLLSTSFYLGTYDAYTHMFFASHYRKDWFDTWDPRWYGGYELASYPPLVHQLIALLAKKMGLLRAYQTVQLAVFPMLSCAVYRFAKCWVNKTSAFYAGFCAIFVTSIAQGAYQWGQLPTLFAASFFLFGLAHFHEWKTSGTFIQLTAAITAFLITLTAHHITIVFGLPVLAFALIYRDLIRCYQERQVTDEIKRSIVFAAVMAVCGIVFFSPFIWYVTTNQVTQAVIRHASRNNFLEDYPAAVLFWLIPWGALIFFFPAVLIDAKSSPQRRPLAVALVILLVCGLGGTLPIFKPLLGPMFFILTFERFTFWATLAILPFAGLAIADGPSRLARATLCSALIITYGAYFWGLKNYKFQPEQFPMKQVAAVVDKEAGANHRYLTLGFGSQFAWLSVLTKSSTVDGQYHTVRTEPILRSSGIEAIDGAKYYNEVGMNVLKHYLAHNDSYNLNLILCADPYYDQLLSSTGWHPIYWIGKLPIRAWIKDKVPPISKAQQQHKSELPGWSRTVRATYPLLIAIYLLLWILIASPPTRLERKIEPQGEVVGSTILPPAHDLDDVHSA